MQRPSGIHGQPDPLVPAGVARRISAPGSLAHPSDRYALPLRALLAAAGLATALVALWLFMVIATVLPARDPAHVPMWRGFALAFLAYAGLTLAFVVRGARPALVPIGVVVLSPLAVAFGAVAVSSTLAAAGRGGHFEGYRLLMGIVLAGHGLCALAYSALTAHIVRRARAA